MTSEASVDQVSVLPSSTTVYCICLGIQALSNVKIAFEKGVWGAMEREALSEIAEGDLVVFVVGLTSHGGPTAKGFPRLDSEKFPQAVDKASDIFLARAKSDIYNDDTPVWSDDAYPWRFRFEDLGSAHDVSIQDIFSTEQIEVLRLCAIQGGTARPLPGSIERIVGFLDPSIEIQDTLMDTQSSVPLSWMERVERVHAYVKSKGFTFAPWQIAAYVTALRTKPFVILAGVSGTGKSKLPQLIAEATGAKCELIPVRPNWTDSSEVLGYQDLRGRFRPGPLLRLARTAEEHPKTHHVCIIDEMNLARVEYYFAEILSRMEDRTMGEDEKYGSRPLLNLDLQERDSTWDDQGLPPNLAIVGTVNMDETTHSFSRKVLDRAFTLEFSDIDLTLWDASDGQDPVEPTPWPAEAWFPRAVQIAKLDDLDDEERGEVNQVVKTLDELNDFLVQAQLQVGYRTRDEAALFVLHARRFEPAFVTREGERVDPLDLVLHMKVLPRIVGGSNALRRLLRQLLGWAEQGSGFKDDQQADVLRDRWAEEGCPSMLSGTRYPQTAARLCLMWDRLQSEGFTSFWL